MDQRPSHVSPDDALITHAVASEARLPSRSRGGVTGQARGEKRIRGGENEGMEGGRRSPLGTCTSNSATHQHFQKLTSCHRYFAGESSALRV
eukprot:9491863-Pyramimonas_sp.AAC.1